MWIYRHAKIDVSRLGNRVSVSKSGLMLVIGYLIRTDNRCPQPLLSSSLSSSHLGATGGCYLYLPGILSVKSWADEEKGERLTEPKCGGDRWGFLA